MFNQHCTRDGKHQRKPATKFHESIKSGGHIGQQQQQHRCRSHKGPHLPGEKGCQRAEKNNQRHFRWQRGAADELAGDDGVGNVPILADEQRVFFQRRCAKVRQVIALRGGAEDDQFAVKVIAKFIRSAEQSQFVLYEQIFNRRAQETRIIWFQPPINVKITVTVHRDHALGPRRTMQRDSAVRQIQIGVGEVEVQFQRSEHDAHVPDALVVKSPDPAQDPVGILFSRNIAGCERVGQKQIGRHKVGLDGEEHVSGSVHLQRKEIIGFHQAAIGHLHGRMVATQFAKQHIERDGFGALSG